MDNNVFEEIKAGMEDALAYVKSDKTKVRVHYLVPGPVDVKAVREKTGLTQEEFCRSYAFSPSDLEKWESGAAKPTGPVKAYLVVIGQHPDVVRDALQQATT